MRLGLGLASERIGSAVTSEELPARTHLGPDPTRHKRSTTSAQQPALAAAATVSTITLRSAITGAVYGVSMVSGSLVIKVTAGKNDVERCNQAFNVAAAAIASGVPVSLWLTGEASWLGLPGEAEQLKLAHATPLNDLLAAILAAGTVTVCTQCAARRDITEDKLIDGVRIAGATTFVAEVMAEGAKPLVY